MERGRSLPKQTITANSTADYDITKLVSKPESGKAAIEAFYTTKGNDLFAILPRWSSGSFTLNDVEDAKSVTLLGDSAALKFKSSAKASLYPAPRPS